MAFIYCISFATFLIANFGSFLFRIMLEIVSKLCAPPSEMAVLFDGNHGRCLFLGQVINLDLLPCTGFQWFFLQQV